LTWFETAHLAVSYFYDCKYGFSTQVQNNGSAMHQLLQENIKKVFVPGRIVFME